MIKHIITWYNTLFKWYYSQDQIESQTQDQNEAHEARAIVLTCMDFRLIDDMVTMMNKLVIIIIMTNLFWQVQVWDIIRV
jgi:hypothetical protein